MFTDIAIVNSIFLVRYRLTFAIQIQDALSLFCIEFSFSALAK